MQQIVLEHVVKQYNVVKKKKGLKGAISNLFHAEKTQVKAVNDISFSIGQGEIVGYIGPNGAGKSTTIKMMSGILMPTSGNIWIEGISPQEDRKKVVRKLGVVFGQRSQLYWDLRLGESFELLKRIYKIDPKTYQENLSEMTRVMDIADFIDIPVRQLSLGQRMRGELVAAMLHLPSILFLDEPTIGLDIDAKHAIRNFILEINKRKGVTVILTTHDLDDVMELCKRLIVINHGTVVVDGPMEEIISQMARYRMMTLELRQPVDHLNTPDAELVKKDGNKIWCRFDHHKITASELIEQLARELQIIDLSVREPDIEDAIRQIYRK